MKKLSTPKLLIILAILIGGTLIVKFTTGERRSKSFRSELVQIDTSKITKIEIDDPANEDITILKKENGNWKVNVGDKQKNAAVSTLQNFLRMTQSIKPSRVAGRSSDDWGKLGVDTAGTRLKIYEGNDVTLDLMIGNFGFEGQRSYYTYMRLFDDENTYVVNNFMKMSISTKNEDFRNSVLGRIDKDSLNLISFKYPDSSFVLSKRNNKWFVENKEADSTAITNYINNLSLITSRNFSDVEPSSAPLQSIIYGFTNSDPLEISSYAKEGQYIISSSENKDENWVDESLFKKLFASKNQF